MNTSLMNSPTMNTVPVYPFTALQGQTTLQLALKLVAVDPRLGGVLIEGARGTAKTTSARALAEILPEGEFVNLPLNASEEQLTGSLDLELVLQHGKTAFQPGLLSRAHQGVLYVDEINLLSDSLVDLLLDVCSSGINRIERDGISHHHAADIVLIGTMNPEEGELRPQLLDRFGLYVSVDDAMDLGLRQTIVRCRLAFDDDPTAFVQRYAEQQARLLAQLMQARERLASIQFSDQDHEQVSQRCHDAQVEGVRADLVMLRASRAMAALRGNSEIQVRDIDAVAELVLAHRRRANAVDTDAGSGAKADGPGKFSSAADASSTPGEEQPSSAEPQSRDHTGPHAASGAAVPQDTVGHGGAGRGHEPATRQVSTPGESEQDEWQAAAASMTPEDSDRQWGAMPAQPVPIVPVEGPGGQSLKKP